MTECTFQELNVLNVFLLLVIVVKAVRKWEADHEDKEKELKKLNIDLATIEADVVASGDEEDPIYLFRKHFSKTGSYLRPDDMKFCVTKTNFTEDQIIEWFQRFRCEKIINPFIL